MRPHALFFPLLFVSLVIHPLQLAGVFVEKTNKSASVKGRGWVIYIYRTGLDPDAQVKRKEQILGGYAWFGQVEGKGVVTRT
jgi:hypothetical protein